VHFVTRYTPYTCAAMNALKHKVELFFDVVSPYAWFGFECILRYEQRWNLDLQLRPVFLGGIMKAAGNSAPVSVPAKGKYLMVDVERGGRLFGVPIRPSQETMQLVLGEGSLLPMRFVTALDLDREALGLPSKSIEKVSREFWIRLWGNTQHIAKPENVMQAALSAGLSEANATKLLEQANTERVKNRLRDLSEEALASGAFGLPWFRVRRAADGQESVFFGSDRLEAIADFLGEPYDGVQPNRKKPIAQAKL